MSSRFSDIEDFSTEELHKEILRRETRTREGKCWYCGQNIFAHTCKHAKPTPVPGWDVKAPYARTGEDCMGHSWSDWCTDATHSVFGTVAMGVGRTAKESTEACLKNIEGLNKRLGIPENPKDSSAEPS